MCSENKIIEGPHLIQLKTHICYQILLKEKKYWFMTMALKKKKKDSLSFISKIQLLCINPVTPTSDQDRISPHNINTISTR